MERSANIKLNSALTELNKVVGFVENICDEHSIYNNYFGNIVTSVSEAFINAVEHGNKGDQDKSIELNFEVQNDGFAFCVTDQGDGFNFENISDPTDITIEDTISGRGLYLMNSLSDDIEFQHSGRKVCLKFLISSINNEVANQRINKLKSYLNQEVKHKEFL